MKIIALRGKNHCGKTTTLNIVHKLMLEDGVSICKKTEGNPIYNDFSDIVDFKNLKIAFFTMGDYSLETTKTIKQYHQINVDFLILASNKRFINPIKLIEKYNHQLVEKTIVTNNTKNNQQIANDSDAKTILDLI